MTAGSGQCPTTRWQRTHSWLCCANHNLVMLLIIIGSRMLTFFVCLAILSLPQRFLISICLYPYWLLVALFLLLLTFFLSGYPLVFSLYHDPWFSSNFPFSAILVDSCLSWSLAVPNLNLDSFDTCSALFVVKFHSFGWKSCCESLTRFVRAWLLFVCLVGSTGL